jgi:hypothetical protein
MKYRVFEWILLSICISIISIYAICPMAKMVEKTINQFTQQMPIFK